MNNFSGVYGIRSISHPDRIYIGSSVNIKRRIRDHQYKMRLRKHENTKLQRHYNKYGGDDLVFEAIARCEKDQLLKTEQAFIDRYNPYFNCSPTAGSCMGLHPSEETRKKLRLAQKNRIPISEETREKLRKYARDRCNSEEGRENMRKIRGSKAPISEDTRAKMRKSAQNKHPTAETRKKLSENNGKAKLVINLETGIFYRSIREAADSVSIKSKYLSAKLRGERKNNTMFIYA